MNLINNVVKITISIASMFIGLSVSATENVEQSRVKLYTLDCGSLYVPDMSFFSDEGKLDGESITFANPCFLIRHAKGDLLWDLGYQEGLADKADGVTFYGNFHKTMAVKLSEQLAELGLSPADIDYLAISHLHDDHMGNANLFAGATFIVNKMEHAGLFSAESRAETENFNLYSDLENATTVLYQDSHDVFGDGKVLIESMPGHTLGSAVLLLRLQHYGAILLSGDLYTNAKAREMNLVPTFVADKQKTLASRIRFETLVKREAARVVIQHDKTSFDALPKFPDYLD